MMLKVGVTGSNGFIGGHLCREILLNDNRFELIAFNRDWFEDCINLDAFVDKCDVIIHLAGINRHSDSEVIFNTNISLTNSLINSFERTNFKGHVLFSSSTHEERDNTFGNSKKVSRELFTKWAIKSGASFKGLIIPNVFGAFGKPYYNSVISTFCHQLINNEIPLIDQDVTLNLIYVNDLTNLIIDLIDVKSVENIKIRHTASYKVSEILRHLEIFSEKYFKLGQIPSLIDNFELNLFNSFRSHINLINFFPIKYKKNEDERGNFVEIIRLETGGQVSFSTTKKGITRGNHFHTRKVERFSVLKGKALIQLRKFGTSEILDFYLTGDEPAFVDMPIWYTHNIKNIGDDELFTMFWINEFYDAKDPDTYFEIV